MYARAVNEFVLEQEGE